MLLFAHGARDPHWALPFEQVAARVAAAGQPVALGFLEFMAPTLAEAAATLVAQGCTRLHVLPLFLGAGGHVRKDLPALLDAVRAQHPQLRVELHPAVGEQPAVVDAMAQVALSLRDPKA